MTLTEKQQATTETLSSKNNILDYLAEEDIKQDQFDKMIDRLKSAWTEYNEDRKKADITEIMEMLKAKGLDISDITGIATDDKKPRKPRAPTESKWIKFEHNDTEYFINRAPKGRVKGELADYLTLSEKTLADLIVDESEVNFDKVVTAADLGTLV
ncbi:hypothetical protein [Aeromonas hydrophila]|uniref:hypothetical protein n=1 Tax=Aeromonas hydrophila TaxID=644 RepID=UPI000332B156|nr:hypothetical protein [Aeromonas hydrophila]AGM44160.1 hypothetical protein AHML_11900 [Aeromonas hydrophila ML09-119]AHX32833.1 hypothetical protein V428_12260 [Aeromonas hydrophila subsp. hydrophila AL09-71]AHX69631.1 hypothetical protein V429_12275 [Aeromonas hydrophila pc104A]AJE38627.1 hypothetical protein V469_10800 [Aeromonas hydrophila J-1]AKJ37055.1 hypothetical protein U876_11210 [Aeromonas hydrophila NJ-35]